MVEFESQELRAWAIVQQVVLRQPMTDVHAKLQALSASKRAAFESHAKVLRFESTTRTVRGRECLSTTILLNAAEAMLPRVPPHSDIFVHSLECIYHDRSAGTDVLVTLIYSSPAAGENDPERQQAEQFFAGLQFKNPPASQTP